MRGPITSMDSPALHMKIIKSRKKSTNVSFDKGKGHPSIIETLLVKRKWLPHRRIRKA